MSEPDAVPLPREGEVFFDVRGEARTMRLSWYADSRVAVFSIWQGNRCTGTFRLPFGDLERMVRILQAGPQPREPRGRDSRYGPGDWSGYAADTGRDYATGVRYAPGSQVTSRRDYRDGGYNPPAYGDPAPSAGRRGQEPSFPGHAPMGNAGGRITGWQEPAWGRPDARYADPEPGELRQAAPAHRAQVETHRLASPEPRQDSLPEGYERPSDTDLLGYPTGPGRHRPSGRH